MGATDLSPSTSSNILLSTVRAKSVAQQRPDASENNHRFADAYTDVHKQNQKNAAQNESKAQKRNSLRNDAPKPMPSHRHLAEKPPAAKKATTNNVDDSTAPNSTYQASQNDKKNAVCDGVPKDIRQVSGETLANEDSVTAQGADIVKTTEVNLTDEKLLEVPEAPENLAENIEIEALVVDSTGEIPTTQDGALNQKQPLSLVNSNENSLEQKDVNLNTATPDPYLLSSASSEGSMLKTSLNDVTEVATADVSSDSDVTPEDTVDNINDTSNLSMDNSAALLSAVQNNSSESSQSLAAPIQTELTDTVETTVVVAEANAKTLKLAPQNGSTINNTEAIGASNLTGESSVSPAISDEDQSVLDTNSSNQALRNLIAVAQSSKTAEQPVDSPLQKTQPIESPSFGSLLSGVTAPATSDVSQANRGFVPQTSVSTPLGQPQWSEQVGEKVLWMASQKLHSAEIRLDPPELGPLQVKIVVTQDQAQVNFTSHHAQVRDVLDQNLPRLREMFSEQGMNLVNVDVSDKSFQRQQQGESQREGRAQQSESDGEEPVAQQTVMAMRLVDHYA